MSERQPNNDQKNAIELRDRNILVSASAGSGKTSVLVERIIQMISNEEKPVNIDRFLVVTFTKAAATEMKSRILNELEDRLVDNSANEYLQKQITLLHNAQITTIDSFCQSVIKNYFHVIDLDPAFKVGDEDELSIMKTDILNEIIEEKYSKENDGYEAFTAFADILSPGRTDSNIEELILRLYEISMSYPWPVEWLNQCKDMYSCNTVEDLEQSQWLKELVSYVHEMSKIYLEMAQAAALECKASYGPEHYFSAIKSDIEQISAIVNAETYSQQFEAFCRLNPERLSAKRDMSVDIKKKENVKALREKYQKNGMTNLKKNFYFQSPDEMLEDIKKMAPVVRELISITIEFANVFAAKKREEGILDFADMEHFALNILVKKEGDNVLPSPVALELQDYYEEIMIDEYQDSNFVQELILTSLCRVPDNKPYLFMVGDVKQSIYQFRLARPELFMEKYNNYDLKKGPYQRIDLHKNYRSRECVLEGTNYIFKSLMQECVGGIDYDEAAELIAAKKYSKCEHRIADITDVIIVEQKSEDEEVLEKTSLEAAAIGNEIRNMIQGENPLYINGKNGYHRAEYRDIVILLRSLNGKAEGYIEVLNEMGIPAYSNTKTGYFSSLEVATVLNMLRIIDNPRQDIPLGAVMRSCLGGFTDEEMAWLGILPRTLNYWDALQFFIEHGENEADEEYQNWDMMLPDKEERKNLYNKTLCFYQMIEKYHNQAIYLSVYEILQHIYRDTGYYDIMSAMPSGEKRAANLDILLQKSIEFSENGHSGIFSFTHYIETLRKSNIDFGEAAVNGENTNAVRIMSIHKSKGLQFPIVFVAGLGKNINLQDARRSTIIDADYGVGVDFIDLESRIKQPTLIKKFIANQIKRNTYAEEIRILYVALTRAEEKLILTGTAANVDKKFEKWLARGKKIDMDIILGAQSYFDWIIPIISDTAKTQNLFNMSVIYQNDILNDEKDMIKDSMKELDILNKWNCEKVYDENMLKAIENRINYKYPYQIEQNIPAKITVSEAKRILAQDIDKISEDVINTECILDDELYIAPKPTFMKEQEEIKGAAKGTLYHIVMEQLPYEEIDVGYDFKALINKLAEKGYFTYKEADIIDVRKFERFTCSSLFKRIKKAAQAGRLKREQPFIIGIAASELYPNVRTDDEEIVMVQGIIDAFFREADKIVLVDYKTDYVAEGKENELIKRYGSQLDYYARALENITGEKVSEKIIYSFWLNKSLYV